MGLAVTTVANGGLPVKDLGGPGGIAVTEVAAYGLAVTKVAGAGGGLGVSFVSATGGPAVTYATWNPADVAGGNLSNGNLKFTSTIASAMVRDSAKSSGKFYWEATLTPWVQTQSCFGVATLSATSASSTGWALVNKTGTIAINGANVGVNILGSRTAGDVLGIAIDLTGKLVWFRVAPAGNWNGSGTANPATGVGGYSFSAIAGSLYPASALYSTGDAVTANFGASAFSGAVPSGFTSGWTT